jgi:hypothetical protein
MKKSMMARIAYAYALSLFGLDVAFFFLSLLLHIAVLAGAKELNEHFGKIVLIGAFIVVIPVFTFAKNSFKWVQEIKKSPAWMRRGALTFGIYALFICSLLMFAFPNCDTLLGEGLVGSASMMGFTAISMCILYTAIWSGAVESPELIRMARNSAVFMCIGTAIFLADRAGFFPHHRPAEYQRIDLPN